MSKMKLSALAAIAALVLSGTVVTTSVQPAGANAIAWVKVCGLNGCHKIRMRHNHRPAHRKS